MDISSSQMDVRTQRHRRRFRRPRWRPTSLRLLCAAEEKMLSSVKNEHEKKFVEIEDGNKLWTITFNRSKENKTPLVMVHGFAGGIGMWALNFDALSDDRPLYAFDLLGFARSSHPRFEKDGKDAENQFVESIEQWRKEVGVEEMILLGHSFGGYLACSYALKYPERIKHLILADPWGFPDPDPERIRSIPLWVRAFVKILSPFNPLAAVRALGPLGPRLFRRIRADLGAKFVDLSPNGGSPVFDYIYHCNAQSPSGEVGFKNLTVKIGYAQNPMIKRIGDLTPGMPVSFVCGAGTWMDTAYIKEAQSLLTGNQVSVHLIKEAGHHLYVDQPGDFHTIVNSICESVN